MDITAECLAQLIVTLTLVGLLFFNFVHPHVDEAQLSLYFSCKNQRPVAVEKWGVLQKW